MSTMVAEVYEALKAAGAPEEKAISAAQAVAEVRQEDRLGRIEREIAGIHGDIKLVKWMMGVLITMNIGIFMMLFRLVVR